MIIGLIGLGLLIIAYLCLSTKKFIKYFLPIDALASIVLTIHAIMIRDFTFIVVNGFISIILVYKMYEGGIKNG